MNKNILIPAAHNAVPGSYVEHFSIAGFSIVATDASFQVSIGNEQAHTFSSGQNVGVQDGPLLGRVTFLNSSGTAVNVTIGDYGAARPTVVSASAGTQSGDISGIYDFGTSGTGVNDFPGVDSEGRSRSIIYITNAGLASGSPSTDLLLVEADGKAVMLVYPKETKSIETSAHIVIGTLPPDLDPLSPATHLTGLVFEVFYSKPLQIDQ